MRQTADSYFTNEQVTGFTLPSNVSRMVRACISEANDDTEKAVELLSKRFAADPTLQQWVNTRFARAVIGRQHRAGLQATRLALANDPEPTKTAPARVYEYVPERGGNTRLMGLMGEFINEVGKPLGRCTRKDLDVLVEANAKRRSAAHVNMTFYSTIRDKLIDNKEVVECFEPAAIDALWRECQRKTA